MRGSFTMKLPERKFACEQFSLSLFEETLPLLVSHWREVAHFQDIPLNPSYPFYNALATGGLLRVFTVRQEERLVGYAVFVVRPNPHYQTSLQAIQDVLYIAPNARGPSSIRFLKFCDEKLRSEGVQAVYHHVKAAHNFGLVLQRLGYELVDLIYTRRLDKEI